MIAESTGYRDSTNTCGAEYSSCDDSKYSGGFADPTEQPAAESQTPDAGEPLVGDAGSGDGQEAAPPGTPPAPMPELNGDCKSNGGQSPCISLEVNLVEESQVRVNYPLGDEGYFTGEAGLLSVIILDKNGKPIKGAVVHETNVTLESPAKKKVQQERDVVTESDGKIPDVVGLGDTSRQKWDLNDPKMSSLLGINLGITSIEGFNDVATTFRSRQTLQIVTPDGEKYEAVWERTMTNVDSKGELMPVRVADGSNYKLSWTNPTIVRKTN